MGKMIVFEGISGSGKSTLIEGVKREISCAEEIRWFDNEMVRNLMCKVDIDVDISRDMYSLCYAIEFLSKYKYYIAPKLKNNILLMHRYYYTPLVHDVIRGTQKDKIYRWYNQNEVCEPNKIIYLNTPPELALQRIWKNRKPSFYECGFDKYFFNDLKRARERYAEGYYTKEQLNRYFLEYQGEISKQYKELFRNKENVLWINGVESVESNLEKTLEFILKE